MASYTSRFIQLTPYLLVEYRYTSPISPERFSYNISRISNGHTSNVQILNQDSAVDDTNNVQERSAVQISPGKFVDLDKDQVPTYLTYDVDLSVTNISAANAPYDTIRYHIVAGYTFEDLDGVIMQVQARERSGKDLTLSQLVFLKDSDFFAFNAKPIFLGERLYDRYVEVKVPAIKIINDQYYSLEGNPSQSLTLVASITSNGLGFLRAQPLRVTALEIRSTEDVVISGATYKHYSIGASKSVQINQSDDFADFSAVINRSTSGDYFEYFASWDGGFIEDFILNANALDGNQYIVINEIRVFEQVGSSMVQTYNLTSIQDSGFDMPNYFRPVLLNAANALSYSIEYTCRLYNKRDSSQVIRVASLVGYDPKTWGKTLERITLATPPEPYRIYNKLIDGPKISAVQTEKFVNYTTRYVPTFFDRNIISVNKNTAFLDQNGQLQSSRNESTKTVYGQGDASIIVTPFDNYYMFTILKKDGYATPIPLDLGSGVKYQMVFIGNDGKKIKIDQLQDQHIANPSKGEILFKIPENISEKILAFQNRNWWIVSKFADGAETSVYQGTHNRPNEIEMVKNKDESLLASQAATLENVVRQIEVKTEAALQEGIKASTQPPRESQIKSDAKSEIPGKNVSLVKDRTSYVASIVPKSVDPNTGKKITEE